MTMLEFKTLSFRKDKEYLQVDLLRLFTTKIPIIEVEQIGEFNLPNNHSIEFNYAKAEIKFSYLLGKYFDHLKNKMTGNNVTYIHQNSDIPLIGNVAFGIVYRNSSIIEIKPVTSCNLDCVYCSISEGLSSKKHDFVVEKNYIVNELNGLIEFVDEKVEIHIGVQGEPFLYSDMIDLIGDLQKLENVHTISIDTNSTLLNKARIDRLSICNKLQINFSLDAMDEKVANKVAGVKYNLKHVKEMIKYACEKQIKVIVAPVLTLGYNENEMEEIVKWIKSISPQPILGIQNYLRYKTGRNAGKELSWDDFYALIEDLEKKHDIKLKLKKEDFDIRKTKELPKPFKKDDVVNATIKVQDRFPNSVIAVSKNRNISVPGCKFVKDKQIKLKILRDKHNVFTGKLITK